MKKNVYIAAPLFSNGELEFNHKLNKFLEKIGFDTFLPQEDGHLLSELIDQGFSKDEAINVIFEKDADQINKCDIVVFVMDGRVPDEGACVEIGLAFAYGKECIGLKTDSRSLMGNMDNPLIIGAVKGRIAGTFTELEALLKPFIKEKSVKSNVAQPELVSM